MKFFYNLKISVKLISSFLVISALLTFVGLFGLNNLGKMNNSVTYMYEDGLLPVEYVQSAQISFTRIRLLLRSIYIEEDKATQQSFIDLLDTEKNALTSSLAKFRNNANLSEQSKSTLAPFDELWSTYVSLIDEAVQAGANGDLEKMNRLIGQESEAGNPIRDVLYALIDINIAEATDAKEYISAMYVSSRNVTIITIVAAVLVSILLGYLISQIISRPLARVTHLVQQVADGNLRNTLDIDYKDEIGQLAKGMNSMIVSLREIVNNIINHSHSLAAASQQISASTQEIASGSASQASDAQMISELFKELSTAIHAVAYNTEQASELSNETVRIAEEGSGIIQSSSDSMKSVSQQMTQLEDDSQKVGDIIGVIEDIADQTNLLALNAAIEAARAGEQGRGFAVVADEVRKLAERSGEATRQITGIIKGMQENTRSSVQSVQESAELSERTGEAFERIVNHVNDAGQKVVEIAAASEEQAAQTATVLSAVENISATTQQTAAGSEETAATAQSLAQLAEELQRSVSVFKLNA
ncbi:methyl-accepting chemotaxis protein [Paenibacillus sanguinis]|uniref:methyl-accepting chemotaxis protein n=1 Tax=Paenibacillus sanguinis TaxID=225906 RepID=UPI000360D105|nr:methyl-accepting chemotaxis protein [Paenibacillus sanguinis]